MNFRSLLAAGAFAVALAVPIAADAAVATGTVNLRAGPGTSYSVRTVVPGGSYLRVYSCSNWCRVSYAGIQGWVSASFVAKANVRPMPPRFGYMHRPWWDDRYGAWYDGNQWWYGGSWHKHPSGFSFGFGFSG
jgi:hypothetical protein